MATATRKRRRMTPAQAEAHYQELQRRIQSWGDDAHRVLRESQALYEEGLRLRALREARQAAAAIEDAG